MHFEITFFGNSRWFILLSVMNTLLFTGYYPARCFGMYSKNSEAYRSKCHHRRWFGMYFNQVTVKGVNSNINTQEGNDGIQFHITARLKCLRDSGLLEKECKKVKKTYWKNYWKIYKKNSWQRRKKVVN